MQCQHPNVKGAGSGEIIVNGKKELVAREACHCYKTTLCCSKCEKCVEAKGGGQKGREACSKMNLRELKACPCLPCK